jgi:hypothetical protein
MPPRNAKRRNLRASVQAASQRRLPVIFEGPGTGISSLPSGKYGRFNVTTPNRKTGTFGRFTVSTPKPKTLKNYITRGVSSANFHTRRIEAAINAVKQANREKYQRALKNLQNRHNTERNNLKKKHEANENALFNKHEAETRRKINRLLQAVA